MRIPVPKVAMARLANITASDTVREACTQAVSRLVLRDDAQREAVHFDAQFWSDQARIAAPGDTLPSPKITKGLQKIADLTRPLRCGDRVRHLPTGEVWLVAYADYGSGHLSWWGWPNGKAEISDCKRLYLCTDSEHRKAVAEWLKPSRRSGDSRAGKIRAMYGHVLENHE